MSFFKVIIFVVFLSFFLIGDSTQFLVANCVWDDVALTGGVPVDGLRGFVLSDADACALFCSKTGVGVGGVVTATASSGAQSVPSAALCDRCCKSSQPPSKPGELLVSILQTLINAFGPSKTAESSQTAATSSSGAGSGSDAGNGDTVGKPPTSPSMTTTTEDPDDGEPSFDPIDNGVSAGVIGRDGTGVIDNGDGKAVHIVYQDSNDHNSRGPSPVEPRQNRAAYPEARIFEIIGRDENPTYNDGLDHATDRGPGWPHLGVDIPLKSGTIR